MQIPTLLEIVQNVLSTMDSDAVQTIGETVESEQIALAARDSYFKLATYQHVPQFEQLTQLGDLSDHTKATVMRLPEGATDIKNVRYKRTLSDGTTRFEEVHFVEKEQFLNDMLQLRVGSDNVGENVLPGNVRVPHYTDRPPTCWTTFDDEELVFDAVDGKLQGETTLHNDSSMVLAYIVPAFELRDDFIPDLPIKLVQQYLDQLKELTSYDHRQIQTPLRERDGERQMHRGRHFASINDGSDQGFRGPSLGRQQGRSYRGRSSGYPGSTGLPRIRG